MKKLAVILGKDSKERIFICEVEVNQENNSIKEYGDKPLFEVFDIKIEDGILNCEDKEFIWDKFIGERKSDGSIFYTTFGDIFEGLVYLLDDISENIIKTYMIGMNKQYLSNFIGERKGEALIKSIETQEKQLINSRVVSSEDGSKSLFINSFVYPDGQIKEILSLKE